MNTFTKTEVFLSVFVQKRSSVNGALECVHTMPEQFENGRNFDVSIVADFDAKEI